MSRVSLKPVSIDHRGQLLRGTFYESGATDRRRPAVVMLHGFTGHRLESDFMFVALGRALAGAGIHAFAFDFRGSGESDGAFHEMLVSGELKDAMRILDWAPGKPGVDRSRLGLLGFSLGGLVASCASAKAPIKALALLAPTTTDNLRRHVEKPQVGSHTLHPKFEEDLMKLDPLGDVIRHPRPTLLAHGTADKAVPLRVARQYEKAMLDAGIDLETHWFDAANHTFTGQATRARLTDAVVRFFNRAL